MKLWQVAGIVALVAILLALIVTLSTQALMDPDDALLNNGPAPSIMKDERCETGARYEAMREAYEKRLPDPCNGAMEWVR